MQSAVCAACSHPCASADESKMLHRTLMLFADLAMCTLSQAVSSDYNI